MENRDFFVRLGARLFTRSRRLASLWGRRMEVERPGDIPWATPPPPPGECLVALVTTGGVHLSSDRAFDMNDRRGDPTFREIPSGTSSGDLVITHDYYDHRDADRDKNVMFPVDRLREMAAAGEIRGLADTFYSFMGHVEEPHLSRLRDETSHEAARRIAREGADVVLLTPA